jgi:hypothetical protein
MKKHWRERAWCCFALLCAAVPVEAEDGRFYGMLRSRDLTPFGFLRLDVRAAQLGAGPGNRENSNRAGG